MLKEVYQLKVALNLGLVAANFKQVNQELKLF